MLPQMLLFKNEAPPGNKARIPPKLMDVFLHYKKDTDTIVGWLLCHGGTARQRKKKIIIVDDLLEICETICSRKQSLILPDELRMAFRHAIDARTEITNHFLRITGSYSDHLSNARHEFFTSSLRKMYDSLRKASARSESPTPVKPVKPTKLGKLGNTSAYTKKQPINRFADLKIEHSKDNDIISDAWQSCQDQAHVESVEADDAKGPPRLADDALAEAFELCKEIQDMHDHMSAAASVARSVATAPGIVPLPMIAFLLNTIRAGFQQNMHRLESLCGGSTPDHLKAKISQLEIYPEFAEDDKHLRKSAVQDQVINLQQVWQSLTAFKANYRSRQHQQYLYKAQDPTKVLFLNTSEPSDTPNPSEPLEPSETSGYSEVPEVETSELHSIDQDSLTLMLQSIGHYLGKYRERKQSSKAEAFPFLSNFDTFLDRKKNNCGGLLCSAELHLFHATYKSYVTALRKKNKRPSCLVQALRFAKEAVASTEAVLEDGTIPSTELHAIRSHLLGLWRDLKRFADEPNFTIYMQSPWAAGSWVLDRLSWLFIYGIKLFAFRHYVGTVLYTYYVLKVFTGFEKIPLFEAIFERFTGVIFPGGYPQQGFMACFRRYCGYRLKVSKSAEHRGHNKWTLPAPFIGPTADDELQPEANYLRFALIKMSPLHWYIARDYAFDHWDWKYFQTVSEKLSWSHIGEPFGEDTSEWTTDQVLNSIDMPPIEQRLFRIRATLTLSDFQGDFPSAKIDFFRIYVACTRIIDIITGAGGECANPEHKGKCLCFVLVLLDAADRVKSDARGRELFGNRELVSVCKAAIREVLGDKPLEDFLWKEI